MTAVSAAFAERSSEPEQDLLTVFRHYKQKYGDDVGLMLTGMHIELTDKHIEVLQKIAALEERLAKLEQKRR